MCLPYYDTLIKRREEEGRRRGEGRGERGEGRRYAPPVTSHMAEVRGSGRGGGAEGIAPKRRTMEYKRWSHRKGSCVNSLPGVCVTGRVN